MTQIIKELEYLKELAIEMMELVKSQLEKSKSALINFDLNLAEQIIRTEIRVDALELNIEKQCENIIALHQPVASDLRFVLAIFKSVTDLERIGDHANYIAKTLLDRSKPFDAEMLKLLEMEEIFDRTLNMLDDVIQATIRQDSEIARGVFKKDKEINKRFRNSIRIINEEIIKNNPEGADFITLYATESKLERSGDLLTNVAEEIIFHIEAEVLKHQKKLKKALK